MILRACMPIRKTGNLLFLLESGDKRRKAPEAHIVKQGSFRKTLHPKFRTKYFSRSVKQIKARKSMGKKPEFV